MLDKEKTLRADLAKDFQERMQAVSQEINELKEARIAEVEKNQEIRKKI